MRSSTQVANIVLTRRKRVNELIYRGGGQPDVYQERYLNHIERKKKSAVSEEAATNYPVDRATLFDVLAARRSQRTFNDKELTEIELGWIYEAVRLAPSSCNRQAIFIRLTVDEQEKQCLDCLLVGGQGWLQGAKVILLLFADPLAYKAPDEVDYMPYLDAGFVGENIYLAAEAQSIGVCYVSPKIRAENQDKFHSQFNLRSLLFCGAITLGRYDIRARDAPKRRKREIFY